MVVGAILAQSVIAKLIGHAPLPPPFGRFPSPAPLRYAGEDGSEREAK